MTTANKITLVRIAMIPVFIWFAYVGGKTGDWVALGVFLLASLTDFLDGYIARKYHQVTDFGKFVDPLADKLLVCAALLLFIQRGQMESAMVFIILAREFIITSLRIVAVGKGRVLAAAWSGKVKTCVQLAGVTLMFLTSIFGWGAVVERASAWTMTLVTLYSGYDYLKRNWDIVADGAVGTRTSKR